MRLWHLDGGLGVGCDTQSRFHGVGDLNFGFAEEAKEMRTRMKRAAQGICKHRYRLSLPLTPLPFFWRNFSTFLLALLPEGGHQSQIRVSESHRAP
jgi:hypothetical protein